MASENIPAWKRLGLKVKKTQSEDPLSLPTHLQDSSITKKQVKSIKQISAKRSLESKSDTPKKPPKRVKLPKNERPPPPEKDQLVYLKEYTNNKDSWKFSKQKQNWLIKNILNISEEYLQYIFNYFKSIQGGSKLRVERELKAVIDDWNEYANSIELQSEENERKPDEESSETTEKDESKDSQDTTNKKRKPFSYTVEQVVRAQKVYEIVTATKLKLVSLDEIQNNSSQTSTADVDTSRSEKSKEEVKQIDTDFSHAYSGKHEADTNERVSEGLEANSSKDIPKDKKKKEKKKSKDDKKKSKGKEKRKTEKENHDNNSVVTSSESQSTSSNGTNNEKVNTSKDFSNLIIEDVNINDYI